MRDRLMLYIMNPPPFPNAHRNGGRRGKVEEEYLPDATSSNDALADDER